MNADIPFVFYGSDEVAKSALRHMAQFGLVPGDKADVAILVSYGKILRQSEIDSYKFGIVNIHPSLLPKLRGPSPIKTAILEGFAKTGVSIMRIDREIDHGPILAQEEISLSPLVATEEELREALLEKGAELLSKVLPDYLSGALVPRAQDHTQATYTRKYSSEDAFIPYPFTNAQDIDRRVRALSEEPGTYTIIPTNRGEKRVKILSGKIIDGKYVPSLVQPSGKKPMSWASFLNGNKIV